MKIAIACDHAGYEFKEKLVEYLRSQGHEVKDFGTHSSESMDYPDTAHPMAASVEAGEFDKGIALCGSGNGINMTVNKHQGIRPLLERRNRLAGTPAQRRQRMLPPRPLHPLRRRAGHRGTLPDHRLRRRKTPTENRENPVEITCRKTTPKDRRKKPTICSAC